ncbi:hypothetical protein Csa_013409 [Cucumis sativus]|uniref:Uncharacterized protein n=1 Tax=Cucumis sativus TaxID=3659 RepID=A0A0A0LR60_CUCSA|nr:hypothetical protein Csa_013409 [Cucumis sativus]
MGKLLSLIPWLRGRMKISILIMLETFRSRTVECHSLHIKHEHNTIDLTRLGCILVSLINSSLGSFDLKAIRISAKSYQIGRFSSIMQEVC